MTDCVLQAEFADYKRIKTRKVMQLIFEIPIEQAIATLNLLGEPSAGDKQITCAIAKLDMNADSVPDSEPEAEPETVKKSLSLSQKCAMLCTKELFWRFMEETYNQALPGVGRTVASVEECAQITRDWFGIKSRAELDTDAAVVRRWNELYDKYILWNLAE